MLKRNYAMTSSISKRRLPQSPVGVLPERDSLANLAHQQGVIDGIDKRMAKLPEDSALEPFEELKKRRDKHGVVRLKQ